MNANNTLKKNALINLDKDIIFKLDALAKDLKNNFGKFKPYFVSDTYEAKLGENDCLMYRTNTGKTYTALIRDLDSIQELYTAHLDSLIQLSDERFKGRESHLKYVAFIQTQHGLLSFASKILANNHDRIMNEINYFKDSTNF